MLLNPETAMRHVQQLCFHLPGCFLVRQKACTQRGDACPECIVIW
jgi:hypothetical protein